MDIRISLEIPAGARTAALVRRTLEGLRGYLEPAIFDDIRLLVTELVSNSCKHAGLSDDDPITVSLAVGRDEIRVSVSDDGPGFEVDHDKQALRSEGGWGLRLVDKMSDQWGVEEGERTTVWFTIDAGARRGRPSREERERGDQDPQRRDERADERLENA